MAMGPMVGGRGTRARGAGGGWRQASAMVMVVGRRILGANRQPPDKHQQRWHQAGQGSDPGASWGTHR